MKKKDILLYALGAGLTMACADEHEVTQSTTSAADIAADVTDFVPYHMDDMPETRSTINWGTKDGKPDVTFSWTKDDALAVFSSTEGNTSRMRFEILGEPNGNSASFTSKDFQLTDGISYYAFSPCAKVGDNDSKERILVKYDNQHQVANKNTKHLGAYDFLAANAKVNGDGAGFAFRRLGAILRVRVGFSDFADDQKVRINKFELLRKDNMEIPYERTVCLTASTETDKDYKPTIVPSRDPIAGGATPQPFVLNLGEKDAVGNYLGIEVGKYTKVADLLVMYMMLPATNELDGQPLNGVLTDTDGKKYYMSMTGFDLVGGTYNSYTEIRPTQAQQLGIKLRVAQDWQLGHTTAQSRATATGDPGVTGALTVPDHIYVYVCKDGYYVNQYTTTTEATDWTEDKDTHEWVYNPNISIDTGTEPNTDLHAYIVVSKGDVAPTPSTTLTVGTTAEDVVKGMTFSASTEAVMQNVYSADYQVLKGKVPSIVATVYHTAALMDVQWNSTAALSGSVSINNLPSTGIKLFGATTPGTGATWTASTTFTEGTRWNGRQTFCVPNLSPATYSITTGAKTQTVTFTAPTETDKGAPWLKANITIE